MNEIYTAYLILDIQILLLIFFTLKSKTRVLSDCATRVPDGVLVPRAM